MGKFDEILNSSDASDALLGEQIDKLDAKLTEVDEITETNNNSIFTKYSPSSSGYVDTITIPNVTSGVYLLVLAASDDSNNRYAPSVYALHVNTISGVLTAFLTKIAEPIANRSIDTVSIANNTLTINMKGKSYYSVNMRKF